MAGYSPIDSQVLQGKPISRPGWRIHRGGPRARGLGVVPGYAGRTAGVPFLDLQVLRGMPRAGLPGIGRLGDADSSDYGPPVDIPAPTDSTVDPLSLLPPLTLTPAIDQILTPSPLSPPVSSSSGINTNALVQQITAAGLAIAKSLATPPGTFTMYNPATGQFTNVQGGGTAAQQLNLSSLTAGISSINPLVWALLAGVVVVGIMLKR